MFFLLQYVLRSKRIFTLLKPILLRDFPAIIHIILLKTGSVISGLPAETGLFRYNGYEYQNFLPDPKNPHAFKGEVGEDVCEDARGRIWVISNKSLEYYDYNIGGFVQFKSFGDSAKDFKNWGEFAASRDSSVYISFNLLGIIQNR